MGCKGTDSLNENIEWHCMQFECNSLEWYIFSLSAIDQLKPPLGF
jgi:hypothetical protein